MRAAALAAVAAFLAFLPSLRCGFVTWDDPMFLLGETGWRGLGPAQWAWALRATVGSVWQPLAWLTYGLDFSIWGLDPRGYHLTSVLLHCAAAALAALIARELFEKRDGPDAAAAAVFAALVFALHPLRVESVTWAAERRDVLCGVFMLSAMLSHLKGRPRAVVLLHTFALLSKAQAAVLPLLLMIADYWPLRRKPSMKELALAKAPLWLLSAAGIFIAGVSQERIRWPLSQHGVAARLAQACYGLVFYARKTVWPSDLAPLYELHAPLDVSSSRFVVPALLVPVAAVLIWRARARRPWLLAAAAFYTACLLPVLGLAQFGPQLVADRYSYVACLPPAWLAGAALLAALRRASWRRPARALAVLALAALAAAGARQQALWGDSEALWLRTAYVDPASATARLGLGTLRARAGRLEEAVVFFDEALERDGGCVAAEDRLADLRRAGAPEDALARALAWEIEKRPVCRRARVNRAAARGQLGDLAYAERELATIALAVPDDESARANLERALTALKARRERSLSPAAGSP